MAYDGSINIEVKLDTRKLESALNQLTNIINKSLKSSTAELDKFTKLFDNLNKVGTSANSAGKAFKELAGSIEIAKTAKVAFDAVSSIGSIVGLVGAIGGLIVQIVIWVASMSKANQRARELEESLYGVSEGANAYKTNIESIATYTSSINETIGASAQEQAKLQQDIANTQKNMTDLYRQSFAGKEEIHANDLAKMQEYYGSLQSLHDEQYAISQATYEAEQQQAMMALQNMNVSLEEYVAQGEQWVATTKQRADSQLELINQQTTDEIAALNLRYSEEDRINNEAYQAELDEIMTRKDEKVGAVNEEQAEIINAYAQGYAQLSGLSDQLYDEELIKAEQKATDQLEMINQQTDDEIAALNSRYSEEDRINNKAYQDELDKIMARKGQKVDAVNEELADTINARMQENESLATTNAQIEAEELRHEAEMARIREEYANDIDLESYLSAEAIRHQGRMDQLQAQLEEQTLAIDDAVMGYYSGIIDDAISYGGELEAANEAAVEAIIDTFFRLPEECQTVIEDVVDPMITAMENAKPQLEKRARKIAEGIQRELKKSFDINSPSRVMQRIFSFVMSGAQKGLTDNEASLFSEVGSIADGVIEGFQDTADVMDSFRGAAGANQGAMAYAFAAPAAAQLAAGSSANTNINQTIYSHDSLSPYEMSMELESAIRRSQWQIK